MAENAPQNKFAFRSRSRGFSLTHSFTLNACLFRAFDELGADALLVPIYNTEIDSEDVRQDLNVNTPVHY